MQRHQQQVITYLIKENRVLKAPLGGRRLRLSDTERRRLAALAHPLGRARLKAVATIATPDTLMRWYKFLTGIYSFSAATRAHFLLSASGGPNFPHDPNNCRKNVTDGVGRLC